MRQVWRAEVQVGDEIGPCRLGALALSGPFPQIVPSPDAAGAAECTCHGSRRMPERAGHVPAAVPGSDTPGTRKVLAVAFACDPEGGSERAAGWGIVAALAEFAEVVVIVHDRHVDSIERWLRAHPGHPGRQRLRFVAVAESDAMLRLAEATPPNLLLWRIRYLLWLRRAHHMASRLEREEVFDVAIHATLGIYWLPSPVTRLRTPAVWGPVGGAASSPRCLWPELGLAGLLAEWAEVAAVKLIAALPSVRRTWKDASVRLVESYSALNRLPPTLRHETRVMNRVALVDAPCLMKEVEPGPYVVFTSPLQRRKGARLALRALGTTAPHIRLIVLNTGPEERHLRRLARRLGIHDRVEFRGRVPRSEMFRILAGAAASVHTGLREEGGAALAEAMLGGVPVIVLAHGGARIVAEASRDPQRTALVEPGRPAEAARRLGEAMTRFVDDPPARRCPYLDQEGTKLALWQALEDASRCGAAAQ